MYRSGRYAGSGSDDAEPDCQSGQPGDTLGVQLALDMGHVVTDGFRAEVEQLGDVIHRLAIRQQAEDLEFARRELRHQLVVG